MSRGLEARLKKLEGRRGNPLVIVISNFSGSELIGYRTEEGKVLRNPGESEEALLARAKTSIRPRNGLIVLRELRAKT